MGLQNKTVLLEKRRSANLLIFYLDLDVLNSMLICLIEGASIVPEDLCIFKMGEREAYLDGYYLMMESDTFPLVKEGEKCKEGIIDFNKGVLTWMKK